MASFLYPIIIIITFNLLLSPKILPFQVPIYILIVFASSKSCLCNNNIYPFALFSGLENVFVSFLFGKKKATDVAHMYVYILDLMHLSIRIDFHLNKVLLCWCFHYFIYFLSISLVARNSQVNKWEFRGSNPGPCI